MADPSALVAAARGGDREALGELVRAHRAQVLGTCRRMLRDPLLAEEAFQEASLVVLLDLDLLRAPARFGAWFTGIALNVCRRLLRERRREQLVADPPAVAGGDVEGDALAAFEARRVRDAVAALPPGQREAVLLFYAGGLTQSEVAAQLGIPVGAVKLRLHRARAALRARLATHLEVRPMTTDARARIEMTVDRVERFRAHDGERHVLTLVEPGGERQLTLWIGPPEAMSIALQLEGLSAPRPMTAALAANLVSAAGGRISEVRIERLDERVYYAVVVVAGSGGERTVDARPSDAITLALLTGCRILVRADVIEAAARERAAAGPAGTDADVAGTAAIGAEAFALLSRPPSSERR